MVDDLIRTEDNRIRFIKEVYRQDGGTCRKILSGIQIGELLGLSGEERDSIIQYFSSEGFFRPMSGRNVALSHQGLKFVESVIRKEMVEREVNDRQLKNRFLITIFDLSGGVILQPVELQDIAQNMGLESPELEGTAQYFLQKGILSSMGMGVFTLTAQGLDYIHQTLLKPDLDPPIKKTYSIFISHWSKEEPVALALKKDLELIFPDRLSIFISGDPTSIHSSDDWLMSILKGIRTCDRMIVLLSPESSKREWIFFELGAAKIIEKKITPICYRGLAVGAMPSCFTLCRTQTIDMALIQKAEQYFSEMINEIADSIGIEPPNFVSSNSEFFKHMKKNGGSVY